VVESIDQRTYQLPSIQRPFVWEQGQILRLLDSVMCRYPIGAVMVWRPQANIPCRRFLDQYESGERRLAELPGPAERQRTWSSAASRGCSPCSSASRAGTIHQFCG